MPIPTLVSPRRARSAESAATADWICSAQTTADFSGSGAVCGAPQMHIAASPMNLFTAPPLAVTRSTTTSKYSLSSATTSEGVSRSEMVVKPRTSRKRTVTWRTSPRSRRSSVSESTRCATGERLDA